MKRLFEVFQRRSQILTALALLAGMACAGPADASVVFVSFGTPPAAVPAGETLVTNFGTAAGLTGAYLLETGPHSGIAAPPAYSTTTADTSQYLAVLGGGSATLALPKPSESISVYIGSLDSYNTIVFFDGATQVASYTGTQLTSLTTAVDNQAQVGQANSSLSNGRFYFTFSSPVTSIECVSSSNSFEIAQVADIATGVPEPSSWAMMLIGFAGLGFAGYRRAKEAPPVGAN